MYKQQSEFKLKIIYNSIEDMKYLEINERDVQDVYNANNETLRVKDINKWKEHVYGSEDLRL